MASVVDLPKLINELITLIKTYLKEQTVVPLKRLKRYLSMGITGSIFMAIGLLLVSLGFLRFLQTLSPFEGTYSFVPYLIVVVANLAGIGIFVSIMTRQSLIKSKNEE